MSESVNRAEELLEDGYVVEAKEIIGVRRPHSQEPAPILEEDELEFYSQQLRPRASVELTLQFEVEGQTYGVVFNHDPELGSPAEDYAWHGFVYQEEA